MSKKFIHDIFTEEEANVISFGVPIGRFAKQAIENLREVSWYVEVFDLDKKLDLLKNAKVFDSGNLEIKNYSDMIKVTEKVKEILRKNKFPIALGGGHLTTLYTMQAFDKNTKLIYFDAHCDAKNSYMDEKMLDLDFISDSVKLSDTVNDVTWARRLAEKINPKNIMVLGVRSGDLDELKFFEENGIVYFTANKIKENLNEVAITVYQFVGDSPVYISVDIDAFDPSVAPAVDHPEPNGLFFNEFQKLVNAIRGRVVGTDLCCLKPIPNNQVTEFLAVRVIFEILSLIK